MKKTTTLLTAILALGSSAFAQNILIENGGNAIKGREASAIIVNPFSESYLQEVAGSPITDADIPEDGELVEYIRSSWYFYPTLESLYLAPDSGWCQDMVYCPDGTVYMKNVNAGRISNTYIKGSKEGDVITFQFPQVIETPRNADGKIDNYLMTKLELIETAQGIAYVPVEDESQNTLVLYINEDGSIKEDAPDWDKATAYPPYIYGVVVWDVDYKEHIWVYYGDSDFDMIPASTVKTVELPEGKVAEQWVMNYADNGSRFLKVCIDGNDVYMGNWEAGFEDVYVKGTIQADGETVLFKGGQLIGRHRQTNHYLYLVGAFSETVTNGDEVHTYFYLIPDITMAYDAEAREFACDHMISVNTGYSEFGAWDFYNEAIITWLDPSIKTGKPKTPEMAWESGYSPDWQSGAWVFRIYNYDVEGNALDTKYLGFNIFVDGEEYTLDPKEYRNLTEPMFDIPYEFSDDYDIFYNGFLHQVTYYMPFYEFLEVQTYYDQPEGERVYSDKYFWISHISVDELTGAEKSETIYYDLQGRKVEAPAEGIFVKKDVFTDGKVKTSKVVLK